MCKKVCLIGIVFFSFFSITVFAQQTEISENAKLQIEDCLDGDVNACYEVGIRYDSGDGVSQDFTQSTYYYEKGCAGGHAPRVITLRLLMMMEKVSSKIM